MAGEKESNFIFKGKMAQKLQKMFHKFNGEKMQLFKTKMRTISGNERFEELTDENVKERLKNYWHKTSLAKSPGGGGEWTKNENKSIESLQQQIATKLVNNKQFVNKLLHNPKKAQKFVDTFTYKPTNQEEKTTNKNEKDNKQKESNKIIYTFLDQMLDQKLKEYTNMNQYKELEGYKVLWNACTWKERLDLTKNDTLVRAQKYQDFMDKNAKELAEDQIAETVCGAFAEKVIQKYRHQSTHDQLRALLDEENEIYDDNINDIVNKYQKNTLSKEEFISHVREIGYGKMLFELWNDSNNIIDPSLGTMPSLQSLGLENINPVDKNKQFIQNPKNDPTEPAINQLITSLEELQEEDPELYETFSQKFKETRESLSRKGKGKKDSGKA